MVRISAVGISLVIVVALAFSCAHAYVPNLGSPAGYGMACPPSGCPVGGAPMFASAPMGHGYPMQPPPQRISKCKPAPMRACAPMACPPPMCPPPMCPPPIEWY